LKNYGFTYATICLSCRCTVSFLAMSKIPGSRYAAASATPDPVGLSPSQAPTQPDGMSDKKEPPTKKPRSGALRRRRGKFLDKKNQVTVKDDSLRHVLVTVLQQTIRNTTDIRRTLPGIWDVFLVERDAPVTKNLRSEYTNYLNFCKNDPKNPANGPLSSALYPVLLATLGEEDVGRSTARCCWLQPRPFLRTTSTWGPCARA
jgi:hypothetical protein